MRNIAEYPITAEECAQTLEEARQDELNSGRIGGIQASALRLVAEFLEANQEAFKSFLKEKQTY